MGGDKIIQEHPEILDDEHFPIVKNVYRHHYKQKRERNSNTQLDDENFYHGLFLYHRKKRLTVGDVKEIMAWHEFVEAISSNRIEVWCGDELLTDDNRYPKNPILKREIKFREKIVEEEEKKERQRFYDSYSEPVEPIKKEKKRISSLDETTIKNIEQWKKDHPDEFYNDDLPF